MTFGETTGFTYKEASRNIDITACTRRYRRYQRRWVKQSNNNNNNDSASLVVWSSFQTCYRCWVSCWSLLSLLLWLSTRCNSTKPNPFLTVLLFEGVGSTIRVSTMKNLPKHQTGLKFAGWCGKIKFTLKKFGRCEAANSLLLFSKLY
jgi:hypothetical protein